MYLPPFPSLWSAPKLFWTNTSLIWMSPEILHHLITLAQWQYMHAFLYVCSAYLPLHVHTGVMWCHSLHEHYKMVHHCYAQVQWLWSEERLTVIQSYCLSSLYCLKFVFHIVSEWSVCCSDHQSWDLVTVSQQSALLSITRILHIAHIPLGGIECWCVFLQCVTYTLCELHTVARCSIASYPGSLGAEEKEPGIYCVRMRVINICKPRGFRWAWTKWR